MKAYKIAYCRAQQLAKFSKYFILHIPYLSKNFYLVSKKFCRKIVAKYFFVKKFCTLLTYAEL